MNDFIWKLNSQIFIFLNQKISHPFLDFLVFFVFIPLFSFLVIVPLFLIFRNNARKLGIFSLFLGIGSYFFGKFLLKPLFRVPRPVLLFEKVRILGPWNPKSFSFPSTTTMLAFGLALPIFLKKRNIGGFLLLLSFLLGFSVIYTGYHTLLDVLGGIFFTFLFFCLSFQIYKKVKTQ